MKKKLLKTILIAGLLFAVSGHNTPVYATEADITLSSEATLSDSDEITPTSNEESPLSILEENSSSDIEEDSSPDIEETPPSDSGETPLPATPAEPPAHIHQAGEWKVVTIATATRNGLEKADCSICRESMSRVIARPVKITLSNTKFLYNGITKKPAVTLYDANNKVISKTLYTKSYASNKLPGTGTVTVTLNTARYKATLKKDFKIILEPVTFSTLKARKEGFRATWKPLDKYVSGYIVSWSTNSSFKDSHSKRVRPRSTAYLTKSDLKGNTRYYVRVRSFMEKNGKTYRSAWSSVKRVRTIKDNCVKLVAVGDDLLHSAVYASMKTKSGYNFDPMFAHIKDDVKEADLSVINQETILVKSNYSTYPNFGSPLQVADAIHKAGFNVVTHATNHTLDRGVDAVYTTLNYWKKYPDITILGIHGSQRDADTVKIVKKNGIRIAMLNYSKGTNGKTVPAGKSYIIDLLKNKREMRRTIRAAKSQSDFVIVFAHWGKEYVYTPDSSAVEWAQFFADAGVDLVIGSHPHVLQPIKRITGKYGNQMLCFYSLGNFIGAQYRVPTLLGGMADVTIEKSASGTKITDYELIPLVTHQTDCSTPYTTYRLDDYTDKLAAQNTIHNHTSETFTVQKLKSLYKTIMAK